MIRSIIILSFLLLPVLSSATTLPLTISRYPSGLPVGSVVAVHDYAGTLNTSVVVAEVFSVDAETSTVISTVDGSELLAFEAADLAANADSGILFNPYNGSYITRYIVFTRTSADGVSPSTWYPTRYAQYANYSTDSVTVLPMTLSAFLSVFTVAPPAEVTLSSLDTKVNSLISKLNSLDTKVANMDPLVITQSISFFLGALSAGAFVAAFSVRF